MNNQIGFEGQDTELFKQFVVFCDKQPKDGVIDHSTWQSCAVGEFATFLGRIITPDDNHAFVTEVLGGWGEDYDTTNELRGGAWDNTEEKQYYGGFTEFLKQYLPEGSYWNSPEPA